MKNYICNNSKWYNRPIIYSLVSVILLSLPWWGLSGYTSLIGWLPMLMLHQKLRNEGRKGFLWWVTLTIMLWHIVTCYWVSYATILAAPAVPIVCWSMLWWSWVAFSWTSKFCSKAISYTVLVCGWVMGEWWLGSGEFGFPWLQMGMAWANDTYAVQWYSLLGSYGGSLWVMVCNVLLFEAIINKKYVTASRLVLFVPFVISVAMLSFSGKDEDCETIEVAAIQPNVDAYQKYTSASADAQFANILSLAAQAPASTQLYVAPESALIYRINLATIDRVREILAIQNFLRERSGDALFIIGASTFDNAGSYNSVLYIKKDGVSVYHKSRLVFGVEYVPEWVCDIAGMIDLGGYAGSLGRSDAPICGESDGVDVGAVVCYESIYGEHFAEWVKDGAEVMCVITNDGWWGDTHGYRQHFSYSRLRAIESGRAIVRSANTGISGIILPDGSVMDSLGWDKKGIVTSSKVPVLSDITPYVTLGDVALRICGLLFGLSMLFAVSLWYKRKNLLD